MRGCDVPADPPGCHTTPLPRVPSLETQEQSPAPSSLQGSALSLPLSSPNAPSPAAAPHSSVPSPFTARFSGRTPGETV